MEVRRLFDILPYNKEHYGDKQTVFNSKVGSEWKSININQYIDNVDNLSYGLIKIGLQPEDKVALISSNRPEWNYVDMAVMQSGGVTVPIYPTINESDYRYILSHSEIRYVFAENKRILRKIGELVKEIPNIVAVYTFDQCEGYPNISELMEIGKANQQPKELDIRKESISPEDIACLMYTSGTTGFPKGVMQTHKGILCCIEGVKKTPSKTCKIAFSFLPLCHAYEKMMVYLYQYLGMEVNYAQNLGTITDDMKRIRPNMMTAVPRILEKIHGKLYSSGTKMKGFKKKLYYWAFELAEGYRIDHNSLYYNIKRLIADKLIYSKWREAIGADRFEILVLGGSALKPSVSAFFSAIGMPVFEGYGLTETSPVICVHNSQKNGRKVSTVGMPIDNIQVRIAEDGEILCYGDNLMVGYYKDEALTKQYIDEQGWFHTGDLGGFVEHGHLTITGRKKSLFKTSFGKYVNPELIEMKFSESPYIEQIVVFGENQKFPAALILPDFTNLSFWCSQKGLISDSREKMINLPEVKALFLSEVNSYNKLFGEVEQIKHFKLISDEWSQENGIMTPTLKVKRKVVADRYKEQIEGLFV